MGGGTVLSHHVGSTCCRDSRRGRDLDTGQGPACPVSPQKSTPLLPCANFGKQVTKHSTRGWGTPAFRNSPKLTRFVAWRRWDGACQRESHPPGRVYATHARCGWCARPAEDTPRSRHAGAGLFLVVQHRDGVEGLPTARREIPGLVGSFRPAQGLTAVGVLAHGIWAPAGGLACEPLGNVGPEVEDKSSCVMSRRPLLGRKYTEGSKSSLNPQIL